MLSNSTLQQIIYAEWGCEVLLGVPSFFINIYTVLRMSQVSTFNINLKLVLCSTSLATAVVAVLHPTIHSVPRSEYLVERRRYGLTVFMYFLQFISHSFTLMANLKFVAVAIERRVAFKKRRFYEKTRGTFGKWLSILTLTFCFVFVALKVLFFLFLPWDESLDDRLRDGFLFEGSLYYYIFAYVVAGLSWSYGIWEFNNLKRRAKRVRYSGDSLSERYEIKQTRDVVTVMRALLKVYGVLYVVAIFALLVLIFFYFAFGMTENTLFYHAWANIAFICVHTYNLFYGCYLLVHFTQLRLLLLADLCMLVGARGQVIRVRPNVVETMQTQAQHFNALHLAWNPPPD